LGPVRPKGEYTFRGTAAGTEVTFTLDAELTGIKKLLMDRAVQKSVDAEMAALDQAKSVLETPR
jgi:hypothetical protein